MRHLPTSLVQKLKATVLLIFLILLFWLVSYSQKPETEEIVSAILQNCWTYPLANTTDINFASDNISNFYIPLSGGRLLSINPTTGKKHWEAELGGDIIAAPIINGGIVYTAAKYNSKQNSDSSKEENQSEPTVILRALDTLTGVTQWQSVLEPVGRLYLSSFENHIVAIGDNGQINSVSRIDGKLAWKKRLTINLSTSPLVKNPEVYLGTTDSRILNLSLTDGRIIAESKIFAPPTVIIENTGKSNLIVGDRKGCRRHCPAACSEVPGRVLSFR
jgi:outer membrane protein assembly factor BamB